MNLLNRNKNWGIYSIIFTLIGLSMFLYPIITDMDIFHGGGALIFLGIIIGITAIICAIVFFMQSNQLIKAIDSKKYIAHFIYEQDEWNKFTENNYKKEKEDKKFIFYLIAGFSVFFCVIFALMDTDTAVYMIGLAVIMILFFGFLSRYAPYMQYKSLKNNPSDIYITEDGLYFNGYWFGFKSVFSKLEGIEHEERDNMIEFHLSYLFMYGGKVPGKQYTTVRIPIPKKEKSKISSVLSSLDKLIKK